MTKTYETLRDEREALLDAIEDAHIAWFDAQAAFEPGNASSEAALTRAQSHYDATIQALDDWIDSPDGELFFDLDTYKG